MEEKIELQSLTTLRVGGPAQFVHTIESEGELREALAFARERSLPVYALGEGSNVLAPDEGYEGVLLRICIPGLSVEEGVDAVTLIAGAGFSWDALVHEAATRGLWGIENLAGIPGFVGAAPVQNIGAYGADISQVLSFVEAYDTETDSVRRMTREECKLGYRDSRFKHEPNLIILRVALTLSRTGTPQIGYSDLARLAAQGEVLDSPERIGEAVRRVRADKFPDRTEFGTAGSFFKNPIVSEEVYAELSKRYGGETGVPRFPAVGGVKIPLAFVLDKVLGLRGHREGNIWLFGKQPLVLVADFGATASEIDAFANDVAKRVFEATGIQIEREVRTIPRR